jgi:hypothetical protein
MTGKSKVVLKETFLLERLTTVPNLGIAHWQFMDPYRMTGNSVSEIQSRSSESMLLCEHSVSDNQLNQLRRKKEKFKTQIIPMFETSVHRLEFAPLFC